MRHTGYRVVLLVGIGALLLGHAVRAEEAQPLQACVLVLPLQASPELSGDQVFLGVAVQHVVEHMLAVHGTLEACGTPPFLRQVFPHPQAWRDWVQGPGALQAALPALGVRYLLTGQVHLRDGDVRTTLELLDRATEHRWSGTWPMDFPRLEAWRRGVMELLASTGLPVPESHTPKMLWPEELSLTAFTLLGRGLYTEFAALYNAEHAMAPPPQFTEALAHAPHSYLVLNKLGWMASKQQHYAEAVRLFEEALAINPMGAGAVEGMIQIGIATVNEALEETWTVHQARILEQEVQRRLAQMWHRRGTQFSHNSDSPHAIVAWEQALTLWRAVKDRAAEGPTLNHLGEAYAALSQYERAIEYYEQALAVARAATNRAGEGIALNHLGGAYKALSQYERALRSLEQALAIAREVKGRAAEGAALSNLGITYEALGQYEQASDYLEQALAIQRAVQNRAGEGSTLNHLGEVYRALGQYERASDYSEQALAITREVKGRAAEGAALSNLGAAYRALGQYERASDYLEQALAIQRAVQNRAGEGSTLNHLGITYEALSQYERAIGYFEQALVITREVKDRAEEGATLSNLGMAYGALSQSERSIDYYEQALGIMRAVQNRAGEGITLNNLGGAYWALSQYERAIGHYEQALVIARAIQNRAGEGATLTNLGGAYWALGQSERAIGYFEQALGIMRAVQNRAGEGATLSNLGGAYQALSQYERAIGYYEQALAIARAIQNRAGEGTILNNLGGAYQALSQYERAIGYHEQALGIMREVKGRSTEGSILNNLGGAYRALSQYERAIDYFEQALAIRREVKNRAGEGITLNNLGDAYGALSQDERAIGYYEQALAIAREVKSRPTEGNILNNLGNAYRALSQYEEAIGYYEQALAIQREVKNRAGEGTILNNLGGAYQVLSQDERALGYYEQALAIARAVKNRAGEGIVLNNLGGVYRALSQDERAMSYYEQALTIHREVTNRAEEGTTLSNLMHVWEARQVPRLAIFYGKQAVNVYQAIRGDLPTFDKALHQSFLTAKTSTYRTLADLLMTAGRLPEAQQVLELLKAEEYLDFVRRDAQAAGELQHATLTPEEHAWAQRYLTLAERVTALGVERQALLAQPARTAADGARLDALEHDLHVAAQAFQQYLRALEAVLRATPEGSARFAEVRDSQALMADLADLGPGTVALYTLVGATTYRVLLITPHTQVARDYPITAADLHRKVLALRQALRSPRVDPRPLAQELYRILVAPVADDLQGAQAQTLLWSLDGGLRYLPMAALHDGEAYLVERYRHVMFTPASQARLKDTPQPTWSGLGLGVSQAHGVFRALPGVVDELQGIIRADGQAAARGVLPGALKLDAAFTAQAMRVALRQRYAVVHIASHFQFRPGDETASFLLLGDGSHLALAELKTWPNVFAGVELLTLSACDTAMGTGVGEGQEVEGLGVLAQRQGAKAVMATLWPVADASTPVLMQEFYRRRETQRGVPKIEALRQAQLALLRGQPPAGAAVAPAPRGLLTPEAEHRDGSAPPLPRFPLQLEAPYAHPFYWAPFILIGNWK